MGFAHACPPPSLPAAYQITYHHNSTNSNMATVDVLNPSARQYTVTNLKPESVYVFRITAQTRKGWGEAAEALVVTTEKRGNHARALRTACLCGKPRGLKLNKYPAGVCTYNWAVISSLQAKVGAGAPTHPWRWRAAPPPRLEGPAVFSEGASAPPGCLSAAVASICSPAGASIPVYSAGFLFQTLYSSAALLFFIICLAARADAIHPKTFPATISYRRFSIQSP